MLAKLDHTDQLTPHIKTYYFRTERPFRYVAGEFTEMHLPHADIDMRGDRRWFTLSSSPTEPFVAITTKITSDGSSFKRAMLALKSGDHVQLAEPMGDFVLPKDKTIPLVFVAAGLGITPAYSIIRYLSDKNEQRVVHLFRAVPNLMEEIFAKELRAYSLAYRIFDASKGQQLTIEPLLPSIQKNTLVYLSGPERFIAHLSERLQNNGVPTRHIITDLFPGYSG